MVSTPPPPPAEPVAAHVQLAFNGAHGAKRQAVAGTTVYVTVRLSSYAPHQRLRLAFRSGGRPAGSRTLKLRRGPHHTGRLRARLPTANPGNLTVRAIHHGSTSIAPFRSKPLTLHVLPGNLAAGERGPAVWLLQRDLAALHYQVPLSGIFDAGTANAVLAYRKVLGLSRTTTVDAALFHRLERRQGTFHVRYRRDGRHVEANLTQQVLAEIEPGGKVHRIFTISSGKPSTPTVLGRYHVYLRTPGVNSEGMVDSNYFIRGYAIHGYAEVPTYPASHGCLRLPVEDALPVYEWVRIGTPVDVYYG